MKRAYWVVGSIVLAILVGNGSDGRRTKEKSSGRRGKQNEDGNRNMPSWYNTDDILEAISPMDYKIPNGCSKEELERTMKRCITIWRYYCRCQHCSTTCSEDDWPPIEAEEWTYQRPDVGWRDLETAWKWAGKCAYNATNLWRIWCSGKADFNNPATGEKERYKYWFLLGLDDKRELEAVGKLCRRNECPGKESSPPDVIGTTAVVQHSAPTRPTKTDDQSSVVPLSDGRQDIIDALGPNYIHSPATCTNDVLTIILQRCILIWQDYCRCTSCQMPCTKDSWPPEETSQWDKAGRVIVGWEDVDNAWKWAGKCAYNATYIWRVFCYHHDNSYHDANESEHEYWFLTELDNDYHAKAVEGLCKTNECFKFKAADIPMSVTTPKVASQGTKEISTTTRRSPGSTTKKASSGPEQPITVPKWAYIIIAVLGSIVILMCVFATSCLYYRNRSKREQRRQSRGARNTTSVDNDNRWTPPRSFTFFGGSPLPGAGEGIYHTITDGPHRVPASPTFPMATFTAPCADQIPNNDPRSPRSVPNVLYHDTTPRYCDVSTTRFSAFAPDDPPSIQQHTYEDTVPGLLPLTLNAPPVAQPYFVPTGEYDTLGHVGPAAQDDNEAENQGNYDHIQLGYPGDARH